MKQKVPDQKMILDSQKHYDETSFWSKVKSVAKKAGLTVIYYALQLYYTAMAPTTPLASKAIIFGALGYFILPVDLIPDAIPFIGYTDDLVALKAAYNAVSANITPAIQQQAKTKLQDWFGEYDESELD